MLFPQHVLPGYWCEKLSGESEAKVWYMWLGRSVHQDAEEATEMPLRPVEVRGSVEEMRCSLGMQCRLHQHMMMQKEEREAEDKEVERNAAKFFTVVAGIPVDEDRVLLSTKLPLTVDAGGILSQEEAEQMLTLLAAPSISTPRKWRSWLAMMSTVDAVMKASTTGRDRKLATLPSRNTPNNKRKTLDSKARAPAAAIRSAGSVRPSEPIAAAVINEITATGPTASTRLDPNRA